MHGGALGAGQCAWALRLATPPRPVAQGHLFPTYNLTQAQFASPVIDFQHVDVADQQGNPLQQHSTAQQTLLNRYDPHGGIPFFGIGNACLQISSDYAPSFAQLQQDVTHPTSSIG